MSLIEDRNKLERLDQFIRMEATGSPDDLAESFIHIKMLSLCTSRPHTVLINLNF